jgi:ribosomal protein S18 acetylase RimI-like enzyme
MTNELILRRGGPADAAAIEALTQAAYAKWVSVIGRKPRPMTVDYDLAVREHLIDVLEDAAGLVALVEMAVEPDHLLIVNLAVAPARQGQGLGSRLLAHAEEVAREQGRPLLRLYTNRLMAPNIALYAARGYAIDREEEYALGGVTVHMSKPVPVEPALAASKSPR